MSAIEATFVVAAELGLHARPAGRFVSVSGGFESDVQVARDDDPEWVNGRSVLSILSLAAGQGTILRIRAEGPDAREAVAALGALLSAASDGD